MRVKRWQVLSQFCKIEINETLSEFTCLRLNTEVMKSQIPILEHNVNSYYAFYL